MGKVSNTICLKLHMIRLSAVRNGKRFTNIRSHIFHCNHKHANETQYKWDGKLKKYEIVAKQVYYSLHHSNIEAHSTSWTLKPTLHSIFLPCLDNRDAMNRVFPPGAAQQSMMVSPGCGSTTETTRPEIGPSWLNTGY